MTFEIRTFASRLLLFSCVSVTTVLIGCGQGALAPATPQSSNGPAISGRVFGGQQPVAGAHVYLFGVRGDQQGVARSLLGTAGGIEPLPGVSFSNAAGSGTDSLGTYVLTAADGTFTFDGKPDRPAPYTYICNLNQVVYALVVGGNPGLAAGTNNSALYLMADLGPCMGSVLPASLEVEINEVTTTAAAFALSGYMSGPTAVGYDNTPLGAKGITNASANVNQLVDPATGTALSKTPNGFGTPNSATLITLANILASCINSDGSLTLTSGSSTTLTACGTLFTTATSDGTPTGNQPSDTITAMLNIAHHPSANVRTLFDLASPFSPFGGGLTTAPNDFMVSIAFGSTSTGLAGTGLDSPGVPAVDANGNVWFPSTVPSFSVGSLGSYAVDELSPLGAPVTLPVMTIGHPGTQVAIDSSGIPWVATLSGGAVIELTAGAPTPRPFNGASNDDGHQIAADTSGGMLVNDFTNGYPYRISSSGSLTTSHIFDTAMDVGVLSSSADLIFVRNIDFILASRPDFTAPTPICDLDGQCNGAGISNPTAMAVDRNLDIWTLDNNSKISGFNSNPDTPSAGGGLPGSPFSGGGLDTTPSENQPMPWLAIDGGGNLWTANYTEGTLSEFANSGAAISPGTGLYGSAANCKGQGLAIDGSGDIWVSCDSSTYPVTEYIGAAVPVYTPLTPGHFGAAP